MRTSVVGTDSKRLLDEAERSRERVGSYRSDCAGQMGVEGLLTSRRLFVLLTRLLLAALLGLHVLLSVAPRHLVGDLGGRFEHERVSGCERPQEAQRAL